MRAQQWRLMTEGTDRWEEFMKATRSYYSEDPAERAEVDGSDMADKGDDERRSAFLQRELAARTDERMKVASLLQSVRGQAQDWAGEKAAEESDADDEDEAENGGDGAGSVSVIGDVCISGSADAEITFSRVSDDEEDVDDERGRDALLWGDRYFEVQEQMKCGRHAVNNVLGAPQYVDADLDRACDMLLAELPVADHRSTHARPNGWYSHSVLAKLFELTLPCKWMLLFKPVEPGSYDTFMMDESMQGILINKNNIHSTCIAKHSGHCFYVDSLYFPRRITAANFSRIMQLYPMSFYVFGMVFVRFSL